ncbi:nuclear transport factor 2 family protein [Streptomyces sp. GMY02]|uniref:nuclear transport factor 2 family protein n=1 Tax=Streptomyces sp. GMY02 TaxID=1333528 RepID=UPI001C2CBF08|nr:nuclear transport factor 2 family protein [Streptomyces sp. GMY02]QXE38431.1 nuclear transport factor 2 family protein [Streptomyces sp. GMY02]
MIAPAVAAGVSLVGVGVSNAATRGPPPAAAATRANDSAGAHVQQILARYVRATDHRDGAALSALLTPQGKVDVSAKNAKGDHQPVGSRIVGRTAIASAVTERQSPLGGMRSEHHVTSDPLVEIHGKTAHLNAQFLTYAVHGAAEPAIGWPAGTTGAQGVIKPFEAGYYDLTLQRAGSGWQISHLRVLHDLPIALPQG